jgi:enolase-phosphatase E1
MTIFSGRAILLDIEGTTSSVRFVCDVMFPFVRRHLERFLRENWDSTDLQQACNRIAEDAGFGSWDAWREIRDDDSSRRLLHDHVLRLMDVDAKLTGLKQLQGLIWQAGFESGELQAHVYDEVPPVLADWEQRGLTVSIYSSGSVFAQRLFFAHTVQGNLLPLIHSHYDTTVGGKRDAGSYSRIAADLLLPVKDVLFVSDITDELDAAHQAGLHTVLCVRPENAPVPASRHPRISGLDQIDVK